MNEIRCLCYLFAIVCTKCRFFFEFFKLTTKLCLGTCFNSRKSLRYITSAYGFQRFPNTVSHIAWLKYNYLLKNVAKCKSLSQNCHVRPKEKHETLLVRIGIGLLV